MTAARLTLGLLFWPWTPVQAPVPQTLPTHSDVVRKPHKVHNLARPLVAVRAALKERGVWYRWGGTSPRTGFDCSGLVRWAWLQAGVHLPRTTYDQLRVGTRVTLPHVRRGDLLFPNRGHVQLALGGGLVIEAAHTGTRIRVQPLRRFYIQIRRPRVTLTTKGNA